MREFVVRLEWMHGCFGRTGTQFFDYLHSIYSKVAKEIGDKFCVRTKRPSLLSLIATMRDSGKVEVLSPIVPRSLAIVALQVSERV